MLIFKIGSFAVCLIGTIILILSGIIGGMLIWVESNNITDKILAVAYGIFFICLAIMQNIVVLGVK